MSNVKPSIGISHRGTPVRLALLVGLLPVSSVLAQNADEDIFLTGGNGDGWGIWGNDDTIWVLDTSDKRIYAYDRYDGSRDPDKDFDTLDSNNDNLSDIWSDGTTMFIVDPNDRKLYAHKMADRTRDSAKDMTLDSTNASARGIWGDDDTI